MAGKLAKLNFVPGFHRESTQYAEEGKWYDGDRVRFRDGKPESLRGYQTRVSTSFDGNARELITWVDNDQFKRAAFGTDKKLYQHNGDQIFDITPVSTSVTVSSAFTVALSANVVTVSATAHGRTTGDFVFFTSVSEVGGNINLAGSVFPVSVINSKTFAIEPVTISYDGKLFIEFCIINFTGKLGCSFMNTLSNLMFDKAKTSSNSLVSS